MTPSARRRPGRRGAGRGTGLGRRRRGDLAFPHPPPPAERKSSMQRNFAKIPRRAREAQRRAAWVTCAQICRAQGRPGRSHHRPCPTLHLGVRGRIRQSCPAPRRSGDQRKPGRGPGPRSTRLGPGGRRRRFPKEREPGAAGREAGRRDPSKVGGVPPASGAAQAGSTCW